MDQLRLTVFTTWLFFKITWSLCRMGGLFVLGFLLSFSPLLAVLVWGIILFVVTQRYTNLKQSFFLKHPTPDEIVEQKINQQIMFWENQRNQQPTDRDVLINLTRLYAAQGNQAQVEKYTQEARRVDPNFQF